MPTTKYAKKIPCSSKSRRFWSIAIDFLLIFILFFIARMILLNGQMTKILSTIGPSISKNQSLDVTRTQSMIFMIIDVLIPFFVFCVIPSITKGKTLGMYVLSIKLFNINGSVPGIKMNFIRFSPYIIGFALIAISQTIIDGERVKMWPSWLINDIDYILTSEVNDPRENIETIVSAVLATLPFFSALGIMFNPDSRMFGEILTDSVIIYDGSKIYKSATSVKLVSIMEASDDDHVEIK